MAEENNYHQKGLIQFIPPPLQLVSAIGHYVAIVWRSHSKLWEQYDDLSKKVTVEKGTAIVQCQYLFYTKGEQL